uniref:Uncharacterized protein n=2 Tax=unclassified bacterial viruses TaxID=12333 RepID=A0AAU6VZT2_9VIRU
MTTIAVAMKTESGDDYLSMFTGVVSPTDFADRVEAEMGEELAYVWSIDIVTDDGEVNVFKHALQERIEQLQGDDFYD